MHHGVDRPSERERSPEFEVERQKENNSNELREMSEGEIWSLIYQEKFTPEEQAQVTWRQQLLIAT